MSFVIDEVDILFVRQDELKNIDEALSVAKERSIDSRNIFCVGGFDDEHWSHIFIEGVCYKVYNPKGLKAVK